MRSACLCLGFVVLAAACGHPRAQELGGGGIDGGGGGGIDGGGGVDGAPIDGASLPFGLELLAGDIGGTGSGDGTGVTARFRNPFGAAIDGAGNLYVADTDNQLIRKITAAGVVTTLAGTAGVFGTADGVGTAAQFWGPSGVAVDRDGNVYVADQINDTIRKITADGTVTTLAGFVRDPGSVDGTGSRAQFWAPSGVAVDGDGNVYVADRANGTIRKVTAGGVVTTLAGTALNWGSADGAGAAAQFNGPSGVAIDGDGNLYVADQFNHTVRKVTPGGVVTTLAGTAGMAGSADGNGTAARFNLPSAVAIDPEGNLYVADSSNATIRKIATDGTVTTLAGTAGTTGSADGAGAAAQFGAPQGVAADGAGNVYVADSSNATIRRVTGDGVVTTFAGAAPRPGSADGIGGDARFHEPYDVAVDGAGNLYVADVLNRTIRRITADGVVTTLAGAAGMVGSTDGVGADARFVVPTGMAVDRAGNLYVADQSSNTIRQITPAGVVTTLAGTPGMNGTTDGAGTTARFFLPTGLAVDDAGNLYVADQFNHEIRKITAAGIVTTLAGDGFPGTEDGTGAAAHFTYPFGVAVDGAANVYVADTFGQTIRKITPAGAVVTLAGTPDVAGSADGMEDQAEFNGPVSAAVDRAGNLYVVDANNATIRKVTPAGITTTLAGVAGSTGIVLGAHPRLAAPIGVAIVGDSLVITDTNAILLLRHGAR